MTFAELIAQTSWAELKAALLWLSPDDRPHLSDYRRAFWELRRMEAEPDPMRIAIERGWTKIHPAPGRDPRGLIFTGSNPLRRWPARCA